MFGSVLLFLRGSVKIHSNSPQLSSKAFNKNLILKTHLACFVYDIQYKALFCQDAELEVFMSLDQWEQTQVFSLRKQISAHL